VARFIIEGGRPLRGTIPVLGNKNAALPMLAAALLTEAPVTLRDVPDILDVRVMTELLAALGVDVQRAGRSVTLCARGAGARALDPERCRKVRASLLLAGPLVARFGRAELPPPGGDVIGRRRLDTHRLGLEALGMRVDVRTDGRLVFTRGRLRGADLLLDEASVTATENLLMAAVLAEGRTVLFNAACEPHVVELGRLLVAMGARIEGLGTNRVVVDGVPALGGAEATVGPDPVEAGSFLAAAAATGGELRLEHPPPPAQMRGIARSLAKLGVAWTRADDGALHLPARQERRVRRDLYGATPKIEDGPWPAFPSDLMSVTILLATQCEGAALFFEKMFESRMYFVDELIGMGAEIVACDPHRVLVNGPSRLHGTRLTSPDIRAGMTLILAALCAEGRSVIENAESIDRGYERIESRLAALGADIARED
jgi:UDP-N-acetylglucosamine 1-carboxyvinyltransferase